MTSLPYHAVSRVVDAALEREHHQHEQRQASNSEKSKKRKRTSTSTAITLDRNARVIVGDAATEFLRLVRIRILHTLALLSTTTAITHSRYTHTHRRR